jgi:hypothetical protein
MVLRTNKKETSSAMTTTNDQATHMIVTPTKINDPTLTASDHHHEIAPTSRCAAHAVLEITTDTEHHSMMTRKYTKNK